MRGEAFAILAALLFGSATIVTRRAVARISDASIGILISVPISVPFFCLILFITGEFGSLISLSLQSWLWLAGAGIVHFNLGRLLFYKCTQLVGANMSSILSRFSAVFATILGVCLLNEPLTWKLVLGVLLIVCGAGVMAISHRSRGLFRDMSLKALLFGVGNGLAWGISPILIKLGLQGSSSALAGTFISYLAATLFLGFSLCNHDRRYALAITEGWTVWLFAISGLLAAAAQLMRYIALDLAPAGVVTALFSLSPVFVFFLSFFFNRKLELFSATVIIGMITTVAGSLLLL